MVIDELEIMTRVMVELLSNTSSFLLQLVDYCKRKIKMYTKASLLPFLFQMLYEEGLRDLGDLNKIGVSAVLLACLAANKNTLVKG